MDPITQQILQKEAFFKKTKKNKTERTKSRFKGEELYYGLEFSIQEFKKFIGGDSVFKNILKQLKSIIDDDVKEGIKKGYEIPKKRIEYVPDDYAIISSTGDKGNVYIQYRLNAHDASGHTMAAAWQYEFKVTKSYGEAASGWDG